MNSYLSKNIREKYFGKKRSDKMIPTTMFESSWILIGRTFVRNLIDTQLKDTFDRDWARQRNDAQVVREVQPRGEQED